MTDNEIPRGFCYMKLCKPALEIINRQKEEIENLNKFKSYFDYLYGKGLEIMNWHLNGNTEPFDNFYEAAIAQMRDKDNGNKNKD